MNLVLDDAEEIHSKTKSRKQLGKSIGGLWELWKFLFTCKIEWVATQFMFKFSLHLRIYYVGE